MFKISKNNVNPKIISRVFMDGRVYFEIEYFDKEKNESCIGFGSFERSNCEQWLREYFI